MRHSILDPCGSPGYASGFWLIFKSIVILIFEGIMIIRITSFFTPLLDLFRRQSSKDFFNTKLAGCKIFRNFLNIF